MAVERIRIATTPNTSNSDYIASHALMFDDRVKISWSGPTGVTITCAYGGSSITSGSLVTAGSDAVFTSDSNVKWPDATISTSYTVASVSADLVVVASALADYTNTSFAMSSFYQLMNDDPDFVALFDSSTHEPAKDSIDVHIAGSCVIEDETGTFDYTGAMTKQSIAGIVAYGATVEISIAGTTMSPTCYFGYAADMGGYFILFNVA